MMGKRNRSHSPNQHGGRRLHQDNPASGNNAGGATGDMSMMNQQMMMPNMMMGQGNMYGNMPNMYSNMMMPNMMGSGMMGSGMEMMNQQSMDMGAVNPNMNMGGTMNTSMTSMDMNPGMNAMGASMNALGGTMGASMNAMGSPMAAPMNAPMNPAVANPPLPPGPPPGTDMTMMGGLMMDPSLMGNMGNMGMYNMSGNNMAVVKKEIILKNVKLTPPPSFANPPPKRAKPPGCRTIFVGGLPEGAKENIVREIFENYGMIHTLRLSTKNFCHIRFDSESCVDAAILISGYRIKLLVDGIEEPKDTKQNTGTLHVDYALSRDDQYEYERRQRQALRKQEAQLAQQLSAQQQALAATATVEPRWGRSPSPPHIQPFSTGAIAQLADRVKSEEHFSTTLPTLIAWLERGECSKKTACQFYSMIQATNSHIRRLYSEKMAAEEEFIMCKEKVKTNIQSIIDQLEQVAKVFTAATHQRVWDHFTKPQRKNIETWQKMSQEFTAMKEEFYEKFYSDEMTDAYNNGYNAKPLEMNAASYAEESRLKAENESLKFQLEAYKNEVDVIKADAAKELERFKAQFVARQALMGFDSKPPLPASTPKEKPPPPPPLPDDLDAKVHLRETVEAGQGEAKLIGVMAAFLQVHPRGASLDYVVSYVRALFPHVSQATIHHVLQRHGDVFQRSTSGVGANIEHRWAFVAFQNTEDVKVKGGD